MDPILEKRIKYLTFIPCAVGPLSILGSSLILIVIYRTRRLKGAEGINTYHHLLGAIAMFDILLSITLTLGPLPMPPEVGIPGARGNRATCTLQAFMFQVGFGSYFYSAFLMVYYVLVVRFNLREATIAKYYEPWFLAVPFIFHFGTAFLGLHWEIFNPQGVRCWVGSYPPGCFEYDPATCERGGYREEDFGMWLTVYPFLGFSGIILISLAVVAVTVLQKFTTSRRFEFERNESRQAKLRLVLTQCFLYGFFFLNVTIWATMSSIFLLAGRDFDFVGDQFWLGAMGQTFYPIQGFFYFLIHIRPSYVTIRRRNASMGRWRSFVMAIWEPESDKSNRIGASGSGVQQNSDTSNRVSSSRITGKETKTVEIQTVQEIVEAGGSEVLGGKAYSRVEVSEGRPTVEQEQGDTSVCEESSVEYNTGEHSTGTT